MCKCEISPSQPTEISLKICCFVSTRSSSHLSVFQHVGSVVTATPFRKKERSGRSHNLGLHQLAKTCSMQRSLIHSRCDY